MRSLINATTTMNGSTGRQLRTGVMGMIQLRKGDAVVPRFYCGPVWAKSKRLGSLRPCRPSLSSEAERCSAARHCEGILEPRPCATRPSHALPSAAAA
jgi:hypothetical protein